MDMRQLDINLLKSQFPPSHVHVLVVAETVFACRLQFVDRLFRDVSASEAAKPLSQEQSDSLRLCVVYALYEEADEPVSLTDITVYPIHHELNKNTLKRVLREAKGAARNSGTDVPKKVDARLWTLCVRVLDESDEN